MKKRTQVAIALVFVNFSNQNFVRGADGRRIPKPSVFSGPNYSRIPTNVHFPLNVSKFLTNSDLIRTCLNIIYLHILFKKFDIC